MLTRETCEEIWDCHREIAAGEKILADMEEVKRNAVGVGREFEPKLKDAFGRLDRLQLGVPSGESSHRLFGVSATLGISIIKAHIAEKQAKLVALNEKAKIEVG